MDEVVNAATRHPAAILAAVVFVVHTLGLASAGHALLNCRTSTSAIAWAVSLFTFPWVTLPLYWTLGRDRFYGYVQALRAGKLSETRHEVIQVLLDRLEPYRTKPPEPLEPAVKVFERLARMPMTNSNKVELLIDGEATFASLFEGIASAKEYVLAFFFIIADDGIGNEVKNRLIRKAKEGVPVYFMYDEMGSLSLPRRFLDELRAAGVEVQVFRTTKGFLNGLQINFRNHRKIVVVDGKAAWVGGVNAQDDSLGRSEWYGPWRDTHLKIEGPAVQSVQLVFAEDYHWATNLVPPLNWDPQPADGGDTDAVYLASGPSDEISVGLLFFLHCIGLAQKRLWIATPYFVPDIAVMEALHLAALRGVDVRVILPDKWDFFYMYLAAWSYLPTVEDVGIQVYRYGAAYTHQKVMLVDDEVAWVGSSNVDNRSMALNFEGNAVMVNRGFASEVERMLLRDLGNSRRVGPNDYNQKNLLFKLGVKLVRLFSPML